jgi:hypothetical protein
MYVWEFFGHPLPLKFSIRNIKKSLKEAYQFAQNTLAFFGTLSSG